MKILTIVGTRPELIRLSRIIPLLDKHCEHVLLHTGQNYDYQLNEVFLKELGIRKPNYLLSSRAKGAAEQIGKILSGCDKIIKKEKPDKVLILGDTNSGLSALIAKRHGIRVYHMEAGNRCFDNIVPEEINRKIIDSLSDVLLPYTERSRTNLLLDGYAPGKIFVTGNPIYEVLKYYDKRIDGSKILQKLKVKDKKFFLVTLHRSENVEFKDKLQEFVSALNEIHLKYNIPIVFSVHPHTRAQLEKWKIEVGIGIKMIKPLGFFDFIKLEKKALCVLSDSGTVPEECSIFHVPNMILRDATERPEILEAGASYVSGANFDSIMRGVDYLLSSKGQWRAPAEYLVENVSEKIARFLLQK
ncbi:MAG: UDP-N-acetylglucosamine 2-epimerase (non-hydrolyzing) [Candidatus Magasanikbacteria bacterium]|nr:UDP-N-acetylglucosamine 2-epimerase (non-hydrolyzing) [Candidatus Magasanikbacteria bacterium]